MIDRVSILYGEDVEMTDELLNERVIMMWLSIFVAKKDHDMLQAYEVVMIHRKHLSRMNDRIIGTWKGMRQYGSDEE